MQEFRDVVTSYLKEDTRILASVLAQRRIYHTPEHEIYLCIYSGLLNTAWLAEDLVTCLVVFKKENLRIMFKLWTSEIQGNRDSYFNHAISRLQQEGRTPFHLIRDAKNWCHVPFSLQEQEDLRNLGIPPA